MTGNNVEKIKNILEKSEDIEVKTAREGKVGRRDAWNRELIKEVLMKFAEILEPGKAKKLPFEVVYDEFYNGSEEHKNEIFSKNERLNSWSNTFIKTASKIAKDNNIPIRIRKRTKEQIFIFERTIEQQETFE